MKKLRRNGRRTRMDRKEVIERIREIEKEFDSSSKKNEARLTAEKIEEYAKLVSKVVAEEEEKLK